jgi:hypothetical protein
MHETFRPYDFTMRRKLRNAPRKRLPDCLQPARPAVCRGETGMAQPFGALWAFATGQGSRLVPRDALTFVDGGE